MYGLGEFFFSCSTFLPLIGGASFFSPLRPSACQSVRMDFLAVLPGVHSIDTLTLTDTESGYSMNLRYVIYLLLTMPF